MRKLLILLIPLSLLAAACGGDDDDNPAVGGSDMPHADDDGGGGHDEAGDVAADARVVLVAATSFEFGPDEIRAAAGEDLAIQLTSEDIEHDFVIDDLDDPHVVGVEAGENNTGGFTAPEPGTYTYYCAVAGHREAGMEGTLVVT